MLFHEEEKFQVTAILSYLNQHTSDHFLLTFSDNESYLVAPDLVYESDNAGELDIEEGDPRFDEFIQISFKVLKAVRGGHRRFGNFVVIDYRDFPVLVTDEATGEIVYDAKTDPTR